MRIAGNKIEGALVEEIFIPRPGQPIIFLARALLDFDEFDRLCPQPKPKMIVKRGEGPVPNLDDKSYLLAIDQYNDKRLGYMVIKSLEATPDLEWDKVNIKDPNTWVLWKEELKDAGFSDGEKARILNGVLAANSLSEAKIKEARESFLLSQQERQKQFSQMEEQETTESGEPVNGSASVHPESKTTGTT